MGVIILIRLKVVLSIEDEDYEMASPKTHTSLCSGTVGAIICLAAMWLASALAFAPVIGA